MDEFMKTIEVAKKSGISKSTLLRWIGQGHIKDVNRDARGWRIWTKEELNMVKLFKRSLESIDIVDIRDPRVRFAMALDLASYHGKS
jgi:DNA-binding transcriptional MerR regulator